MVVFPASEIPFSARSLRNSSIGAASFSVPTKIGTAPVAFERCRNHLLKSRWTPLVFLAAAVLRDKNNPWRRRPIAREQAIATLLSRHPAAKKIFGARKKERDGQGCARYRDCPRSVRAQDQTPVAHHRVPEPACSRLGLHFPTSRLKNASRVR